MDEAGAVIICLVGVIALAAICLIGGIDIGESRMQQAAVDRGYAEWTINKTGSPKWSWKKANPTEKFDPMAALDCVKDVLSSGRISEGGKAFCAATAFGNRILVLASRTPKGNDCFKVQSIAQGGDSHG